MRAAVLGANDGIVSTASLVVGVAAAHASRHDVLLTGVAGLFGFHFLLFVALRFAPPVEANLVNYLWPLLIVLLTPVILPGWSIGARHVTAALLGLAGAALAIGVAPAR